MSRRATPFSPQQQPLHVALAAASIVVAVPLVWLVLSSFKSPDELLQSPWALPHQWTLDNFTTAWSSIHLGRLLANSAFISVTATLLTLIVASLSAYSIAFRASRYTKAVYGMLVTALFLPTDLLLLPIYVQLRSMHLLNNYLGVLLPYAAFGLPLAVLLLTLAMRALPRALVEAAELDGASSLTTLIRIILPLIKPAIGAVVVLTVINNWNEFLVSLLVLQKPELQTVPIGLASFTSITTPKPTLLLAAVTISIIPTLLVFLIFQRTVQRGAVAGSVR